MIMRTRFFYLLSLMTLLALIGCNSRVNKDVEVREINYQRSIINFSSYNSEYENWMSFPVWFNDSLIQANNILSIKRELFSHVIEDTNEFTNEFLDKRWLYTFNDDGTMSSVVVSVVYDAKTISEVVFKYKDFDRKNGYAQVHVSEREMADYENLPYIIHNKNGNHNHWSSYTEWSNQHQLFILNNPDYWKALVIDTMIGPKPVDYIFWGGLIRPVKSYKVSNLVEESNVRNFLYKNDKLMEVDRVEDPFGVKRSFRHNENGLLTDIIDSTFSMGGFVSAAIMHLDYKDGLPAVITKSLVKREVSKVIFIEKFAYTFKQEAGR